MIANLSCRESSSLRILTLSNCPALEYLGSGYVIANFVNGLRELGHEVDLLQPDDYEIYQRARPRANSYRQSIGMVTALRKALKRKKYDLVELWGGEAWLATQWLIRKEPNHPMVVQHTNGPETRYSQMLQEARLLKLNRFQKWYAEKLVLKAFYNADAIVTVSEYDKEWLVQQGLPISGRIKAIENPLSDCFISRHYKSNKRQTIGFCGTWLPKKGITLLARDITRLLREFPEWEFLVLGTGPDSKVLDSFPADIHSKIEVMPMIKDKEKLAQQYERMKIFVLPSLIESFGVALAEAMACGCAVVTTRVGLGASLRGGHECILLEKVESPYLYESVKQLILNSDLQRQLGLAARERVQSLRWDRAVQALSDTYKDWFTNYQNVVRRDAPYS